MTVRTATVSVSSTRNYVDLKEAFDGIIIENQGTSTAYIRITKEFSAVTLQDLQLKAGQSVQILQNFRYLGFLAASTDTTTLQYTAFNRG